MSNMHMRTGGRILVDQLIAQGVDHIFCVPGESYLAVLDALYDTDISVTVCRQEGGAAMMAEAYAKLTGKIGICMVTRAPGATNAYAGIHIAKQDDSPMILFVGQVARDVKGREAFQEMDYLSVFNDQTKWVTEINQTERIPEILRHAFHMALSGRPGPVVIALPEDMLRSEVLTGNISPCFPTAMAPTKIQWDEIENGLNHAQKPLLILGGSTWDASGVKAIEDWSLKHQLPVSVAFRRQMLFDAEHACYVGDIGLGLNPALWDYIGESDCIVLIGDRLSEVPSQNYTLLAHGIPKKLIHIHPDVLELNRVYPADIAVNTTGAVFAKELAGHVAPNRNWTDWTRRGRLLYQKWNAIEGISPPGTLNPAKIMTILQEHLRKDAIITNGAGNYASWVHRFFRYRAYGTQLAPTSGSMGYGLPAAVSAKRIYPDKEVICFAGDGCFLMHGQEFATAVQYRLPIIVIILDNGMFGTIRMHQEAQYPNRISATQLQNPDFADYARAFGGYGERVETDSAFLDAFLRAQKSGLPSILHCVLDKEAITPVASLSQIRQRAIDARGKD